MTPSEPTEDQLRRLYALSQDLLCAARPDGWFTWINPRFTELLGWSGDEILARPFLDLVHPDDQDATVAEMAHLAEGWPSIGFTNRYRCRDGSWRWLSWTCTPDPDSSLLFASARDVTERVAAQRAERELVAMVSHELRTPLTSIHGALAMLAAGTVGALDLHATRLVDVALRNSSRLSRLVDDLLDAERIAAGRVRLDLAPLPLAAALETAAEGAEAYAGSLGVRLETAPVDRGIEVVADAVRVAQILDNLVSNAVKHSPDGGVVALRVVPGPYVVRVEVADHGPGVPAALQPHLFQRWATGDSGARRAGTGLGLSIARTLVEQHGGRIGHDEGPHGGATFWFELWRGDEADVDVGDVVLVVERDPQVARHLGDLLAGSGRVPRWAVDAAAARAAVRRRRVAGVVVDPSAEGAVAWLASLQRTPGGPIPLLLVTATVDRLRGTVEGAALPVHALLAATAPPAEVPLVRLDQPAAGLDGAARVAALQGRPLALRTTGQAREDAAAIDVLLAAVRTGPRGLAERVSAWASGLDA